MQKLCLFLFFIAKFFFFVSSTNVVELNSSNFDNVIDGSKFVFVLFYASWDEQSQKVLGIYDEVGDKFVSRNDIIIAKVNAYEDTAISTRFWIDRYPIFRYFIKGSKTEETYKGGIKADDFIRFIQSRSEITFDKDIFMRPVVELDGSNFERIMKDRTKNLMVFYYNGHCPLCRQMEYPYHQLGLTFRNEPDCVVSKLDCDAHALVCLDQIIPHYPTLRIYTKKNKDGFTYEPGKNNEFYSLNNMTIFMNAICKTQRIEKGRLNEEAGRLAEFDELAKTFMKDWEKRVHILREVQEKSSSHDEKEYASYYALVMGRVAAEGDHVLGHEIERLERLIAGQVHLTKADELEKRKNILKQFHKHHQQRDEL